MFCYSIWPLQNCVCVCVCVILSVLFKTERKKGIRRKGETDEGKTGRNKWNKLQIGLFEKEVLMKMSGVEGMVEIP
jgi:hypothetical protein